MSSFANIILFSEASDVAAVLMSQPDMDLNQQDEYGFTPLIEAAIAGKNDTAKLLLEHGADPNGEDMTGGTALHWACENENIPLATLLLSHNANANQFNHASQPPLVTPLLRDQNELKLLLYKHQASLVFAQDYINTKLLAHRFQLQGQVDIATHEDKLISLNLEGFIFEFSTKVLATELMFFLNNFASRPYRRYMSELSLIGSALQDTAELASYQQYQVDHQSPHINQRIQELINFPIKILPVNFEGHAITLVIHEDLLAICDRRMEGEDADSIIIFRMKHPQKLSKSLIKKLIYEKKPAHTITHELPRHLGLEPLSHVMIQRQITGNCSWANVEAAVPLAFIMLSHKNQPWPHVFDKKHPALKFFDQWTQWNATQALNHCIEGFYTGSQARKISKASILAAILFQRCTLNKRSDQTTIDKIMPIICQGEFRFILDHYLEQYQKLNRTAAGKNLKRMIDDYLDTH